MASLRNGMRRAFETNPGTSFETVTATKEVGEDRILMAKALRTLSTRDGERAGTVEGFLTSLESRNELDEFLVDGRQLDST